MESFKEKRNSKFEIIAFFKKAFQREEIIFRLLYISNKFPQ